MRKISPFLILFICFAAHLGYSQKPEDWQALLTKNDLSNWSIKFKGYQLGENYKNTFQMDESTLKVDYSNYDSFKDEYGHIYYNSPFSYYRLKLEYRFTGNQVAGGEGWAFRNNGVMIHSQPPSTVNIDQDFPISLEAQLLGGNGKDKRHTLNLCTPGTHVYIDGELVTNHCIDSHSKTYHGDQWVSAEIIVYGDSLIQHIVNDELVFQFTRPEMGGGEANNLNVGMMKEGTSLTEGYIALQAESHPTEFRNIYLLDLEGCMDNSYKSYREYYVKHNEEACSN